MSSNINHLMTFPSREDAEAYAYKYGLCAFVHCRGNGQWILVFSCAQGMAGVSECGTQGVLLPDW